MEDLLTFETSRVAADVVSVSAIPPASASPRPRRMEVIEECKTM